MSKEEKFLEAVLYNRIHEVKEMLGQSPALIKARDDEGWTALHLATGGSHELIELLMRKGADPTARNNDGETPAVLAERKDRPEDAVLICELAGEAVSDRLAEAFQAKILRDKKVRQAIEGAKEKRKKHGLWPKIFYEP